MVTNVNTMKAEYCHVKTTPNMPVRLAVRMSMSIPGKGTFCFTNHLKRYWLFIMDAWRLVLEYELDSFV